MKHIKGPFVVLFDFNKKGWMSIPIFDNTI